MVQVTTSDFLDNEIQRFRNSTFILDIWGSSIQVIGDISHLTKRNRWVKDTLNLIARFRKVRNEWDRLNRLRSDRIIKLPPLCPRWLRCNEPSIHSKGPPDLL
jgi:predicted amidohydrolase